MSITILGGSLSPKLSDGSTIDAVYGVDASGCYLGIVPAAAANSVATCAPPSSGAWRWSGSKWTPWISPEQQALSIEQERDARIDAGVSWNGGLWYSDATFQQQIAGYLQAWNEGILAPTDTVPIRSKDKVVQAFTRDQLRQLSAAVMEYVQSVWAWSWTEKAKIQE